MSTKTLPITGLEIGGVSPAVLVCGDPGRAKLISEYLETAELISQKREYHAYRGSYQGMPVTVCSHGVGAPGAAIAFEELIAAGAKRIIRVGTCGGLQPDIVSGHLIVATAAVQNTGYGRETVPDGYPAVADLQLALALMDAATRAQHPFRAGFVLTRDSFYVGLPAPAVPEYQVMSTAHVLAVEMECAALFLVGSLREAQTGAILAVDGNVLSSAESMDTYRPDREVVRQAVGAAIEIGLSALKESD